MKITSIPQIYRHVHRWREIIAVLSRYGLANWIHWLDLEFAKEFLKDASGEAIARQSTNVRIRLALGELGPTFIKLGQMLSTRADLIGVELADELQKLQDDTPADAAPTVRRTIETELGKPLDALFASFEEQPLASASIGQVHRARLHDGQAVVVKVRHEAIGVKVGVDLDILAGVAMLAERIPELANYRPSATVQEVQRSLRHELDFRREVGHMRQIAADLAWNPRIRIPRPVGELCSSGVLTMEELDGIRLSDHEGLLAAGVDLEAVARLGAELYLEMIFVNGFFHADPHPGNLLVLPGGVVGLLDFGLVGRLDAALQEAIEDMLLALANRDARHLTAIITRIGAVPQQLDHAALAVDVADFVGHYAEQQLDSFDLSGALRELTEMIRRYRIRLPARLAVLLKMFVMLEGMSRKLSPRFSLMEVMQPYQRKLLRRRMSPRRHFQRLLRVTNELEHLAETLPRGLVEILEQIQTGKFDVHLDHRGLEPSVNRLVLGMLTSALFLGSSLLLSRNVPPMVQLPWFEGMSVLGLLGCVTSLALGMRLLWAINKSGHLDRRN
jgi:ubiquinone biosynthesis protein